MFLVRTKTTDSNLFGDIGSSNEIYMTPYTKR